MEISLALILDELGLEADTYIQEGTVLNFRSVELYVVGQTQFSHDTLLICKLSEAVAAEKRDGAFFLCVRDKAADGQEKESAMQGVTVVRGNIGLRELFNRVQRVFVKVSDWVMAMERSVAKRGGLQELLDLSESIFHGFITIQDSTFKLIAHTKSIKPPTVVMSRLVQYGYHPPETMEHFRKHRRLEQFKRNTDVIISTDRVTSDGDVVKKTFHLAGSIFIMVVMDCCGRIAGSATVELFGILIEYIRSYIDLDIAQTGGVGGVKALTLDILNKTAGSKEEARIRSTYCGYPFEGDFRLYAFSFEDEDNVPIAHLIDNLTRANADTVAFLWNGYMLMIESGGADVAAICKSAESVLGAIDFKCGISNGFDCLWDLPMVFEQSVIAMDISSRLKPSARVGQPGRFRKFSDNLIYHIVSAGFDASPGALEASFLTRSVTALREYDEQHRTDTMKILRLFLENERSATVTSTIMHMHRNTVLYHMEKISRLLGLSLDDPDTRLQLLLSFKADDFSEL
jgi:hypothetical protein